MRKLIVGCLLAVWASPQSVGPDGTRAAGLRLGAHAVGFDVRRLIDPTRRVNASDDGVEIGLANWYPAQSTASAAARLTSLDYRLLDVRSSRSRTQVTAFEEGEIDALVAWRHVGVVELSRDEARASLHATGIAVRDAPAVPGRFPVVVIAGGPYYLSTTAELLASHGFLVVAPFRFQDQSNEIEPPTNAAYLENVLRDAEWALADLRRHPRADTRFVSTLGHGGGGMQAMLLAMRNRDVRAAVNIDAGNFSTRSEPRNLPFYSPRAMRTPYLYIATAATRQQQDLFDDFAAMHFAERFEVVLEQPGVKHHDLSDIGRAVTAPLGLRGDEMAGVQETYVAVHEMIVRFLQAAAGSQPGAWRDWVTSRNAPGRLHVVHRPGKEPAPTLASVLSTLGASTASTLAEARARDPEAPLFQVDQLAQIVRAAIAAGDFDTADPVSALALEWRREPILAELRSRALEGRGDVMKAIDAARTCAAMEDPHWSAAGAVDRCRARLARLTMAGGRQ